MAALDELAAGATPAVRELPRVISRGEGGEGVARYPLRVKAHDVRSFHPGQVWEEMLRAFRQSARFEWMFWDSAPAVSSCCLCTALARPLHLITARLVAPGRSRHSGREAGPLGAQPRPQVLEPAASRLADSTAFDPVGAYRQEQWPISV